MTYLRKFGALVLLLASFLTPANMRKAAEEMQQWALRSEMHNPPREKWPQPVDSARNLYEYYEYQIAQSAVLFAKYGRLADAAAEK